MHNIGAWTDIYALGATLYNLLTKKNPPTFDVIFSEGSNAFSFPSYISSSTRELIIKMMNPDKKNRPQTIGEINRIINNSPKTIESKTLYERIGISIIYGLFSTIFAFPTLVLLDKLGVVNFEALRYTFPTIWFIISSFVIFLYHENKHKP